MALELFADNLQGARVTLEFSARNTVASTPLPATHYLALAAFEQNRTEAVRRVLIQGIAALPYANHLYEQVCFFLKWFQMIPKAIRLSTASVIFLFVIFSFALSFIS